MSEVKCALWTLTLKFDTGTWPFLKFDMQHGGYRQDERKIVTRHGGFLKINLENKSILGGKGTWGN